MSTVLNVPVGAVDSNPFRQLERYPYVERKLDTLVRSYADVGMWEGVIARQSGNRYEIAFGHHRVEAARRAGFETVPVIVRPLTDEQMLQFMGRENMEDYNADFLCMLETWEAAVSFKTAAAVTRPQTIEIARLLGWTVPRSDSDGDKLDPTALACNAAYALILGGHLDRSDLVDHAVSTARQIVERAQARMEQLDRIAEKDQHSRKSIEQAKSHIAKGAKATAQQVRDKKVAWSDIKAQVDVNAYRHAREAKKKSPLFARFVLNAANSISRFLNTDKLSEQLAEVQKTLSQLTLDDDKQALKRLDYELEMLGDRAGIWRKRLTPIERKVTRLQVPMQGGAQ